MYLNTDRQSTSCRNPTQNHGASMKFRAGQYWRQDRLRSFDELLEKKLLDSRRKAC
jgi:hypothetical protein